MNTKQRWLKAFEEHSKGVDTFWLQVEDLEQFLLPLGYVITRPSILSGNTAWRIVKNVYDKGGDNIRHLSLQSAVRLFNGVTYRITTTFVDVLELKEDLWFTVDQWQAAQATKEITTLKLYKSAREGWKLRENWVEFL